jgi:tRNA(Arg) A34 adenosine deaminase TadA
MKINSTKFNKIVEILRETAEKSTMYHRHACALLSGGKILSIRVNTQNKLSKHAEMNVIDDCISKGISTKSFIMVLRISRTGTIHDSKPCSECLKYMKKYGVKRICYSNQNGDFVIEKACELVTNYKTLYYRILEKEGKVEVFKSRLKS